MVDDIYILCKSKKDFYVINKKNYQLKVW